MSFLQKLYSSPGSRAWLKMTLLIFAAGLTSILLDLFVAKPYHWVMAVACSVPMLAVLFVILPLQRQQEKK